MHKEVEMTLSLTSTAFSEGESIPIRYTCEGQDISPPLAWSGVPEGTKSFVLIVDDPDAPDPRAPKVNWVHWVVYNMGPSTAGLAEGGATEGLPLSAQHGLNDWKRAGYGGPCPPIGRHRYFHKLYALDTMLSRSPKMTKGDVESAMEGHVLAKAVLVGTYEKQN